jgi:cell division cycle 2-like protein
MIESFFNMGNCFNSMVQEHRVINEFDILNKIGEGRYGIVSRACHKRTHEVVAIKESIDMKTALLEINILVSLHHPSMVHLKEVIIKKNVFANIVNMKAFIVMEYIEYNLYDFMLAMKWPFSQSEVKCLMFQLIDGVKYMHDNWVLHRDLKPCNILLNNHGELKICDFGMACRNEEMFVEYTNEVVTLNYRAPELLGATKYSNAIDMWSLGCIMGQLLTKRILFPGRSEIDQIDKIFKMLGTPNEKTWHYFVRLWGRQYNFFKQPFHKLRENFPMLSEQGYDLLNRLLTYDPQKRINAKDALNHEWFRGSIPKAQRIYAHFPHLKFQPLYLQKNFFDILES